MIRMTYNDARAISRNRELVTNLVQSKLSFSVSYNLRKILDQVGQASQRFDLFEQNLQMDIAKRLAVKDEKGEFATELPEGKTEDADRVIKFTDENRSLAGSELFKAVTEFGKQELVINRKKLDFSNEEIKLRLVDLPLLDLIMLDPEEASPVVADGPAPDNVMPLTSADSQGISSGSSQSV